jgi:hypothetical protein
MELRRNFAWLLLCLPVVAVASPPAIEVSPPTPDAGATVRFKVRGEWPDGCPPTIRDVRIVDRDIVLTAQPGSGPCGSEAQAFETGTEALPLERAKLTRNGVHRIRFELRRTPEAAPELLAFRLFYVGNTPDPGFVPESGFWWHERGGEFDRAGPGLGAQMEVQSGTLALGVHGYAADGSARWSLGAGPMQGHVATVELTQLSGGAGPFEPFKPPGEVSAAGSALVELVSPSRVTLWFLRPRDDGKGLQVRPVSMVRFRFAREPAEAWRGRWVVLAESDDDYPTRRIDFVRLMRKQDGFLLLDAKREFRLRCETDSARPNSPPTRCRLQSDAGDAAEIDFDHVALNELRGWTGAGQRIVALKLNR